MRRFRAAFGAKSALEETPGHLADATEKDDAISILIMSMEFYWDCFILCSSGNSIFYTSHDEFFYFGSTAIGVVDKFRKELEK